MPKQPTFDAGRGPINRLVRAAFFAVLEHRISNGIGDMERCHGCGTECNFDDMSRTDDDVWLCPGCWDSVCEEIRHSANDQAERRVPASDPALGSQSQSEQP